MLTEKSGHSDIFGLLPWYANGTLADAERRVVANHLGQCPTCQAYYADLRALTPHLFVSMPGAATWQPTPQGFAALMDKVNAFEVIHPNAAKKTKKNTSILEWFQNRPNFTVVALGVETLALVCLVVSFSILGHLRRSDGTVFETLSDGIAKPQINLPCYTIVFKPQATAETTREILLKSHAQIRNGPSSLGAYSLQMADLAQDQLGQAVAELKASQQVALLEVAPQTQCQ